MIRSFSGATPVVEESALVAETAQLIGDVTVGERASIWYGAVLRGDYNAVSVGAYSNIQDNCVLHITNEHPCTIGDHVTVGHGAIVHGCTVGDEVLIGMGAIVLDGAVVEDRVIIGAGALIPPGRRIPSGYLAMGSPAKVVRPLDEDEIRSLRQSAEHYAELAEQYRKGGCL